MTRFLSLVLTLLLMPLLALGQSTAILDGVGLANGKSYTNYIKNPNAQKNVSNVTASNLTVARSTTTPLYSGAEFNLTSTGTPWSATWSALAFDAGMKNRLCEVQIMLRGTAAGTTTLEVLQNSVAVFTQTITLDATNPKKYGGTFPCGDLTYASTVKLSGTGATTGAIEAGAVYLGEPVSVSSGAVVTEWQDYTPTLNSTSNVSANLAKWRRVGSSIQTLGYVSWNGTGAATTFTVDLPSGLTTAEAANTTRAGDFAWFDSGTGIFEGGVTVADSNSFSFTITGATTAFVSSSAANGDVIRYNISIPISGWSATDIVTPESSISGQARYSTNSANTIATGGGNTVIDFEDKTYDINNEVVTGSSWKYTAKTAGYYQVNAKIRFANSQAWTAGGYIALKLYKTPAGGAEALQQYSDQTFDASTTPAQGPSLRLTDVVYLGVGDALQLKAAHGEASDRTLVLDGTFNQVSISKVTGPGSQSFYISSPLVAPPDGTGIKLKSSANVDLMTINDTTGAAIIGASSGATGGHSVRANTTIPFTVKNNNTADNSFIQFANGTGTLGYIGFNPSTGFRALASNGSTDWGGSDTNGKWDFGPSTAGNIKHKANGSLHAQFSTGIYNIGGYTTNDSVTLAATGGTDSLTITTDTGNSGYLLSVNGVSPGSGALLYITYASATITKLADPNSIIAAGSLAVTKSASSYDVKIENLSGGAFALGVQAIGAKITAATPGT